MRRPLPQPPSRWIILFLSLLLLWSRQTSAFGVPGGRACRRTEIIRYSVSPNDDQETTTLTTPITETTETAWSRRDFLIGAAGVTSGSLALSSLSSSSSSSANAATSSSSSDTPSPSLSSILQTASQKALYGGRAGASAAVVQVLTLMWLRTAMNYQYRYGGTLSSSLSTLYAEGGVSRLYQGLPLALVQGPLTRFGDTAANVGMLVLLDPWDGPLVLKTLAGSLTAGAWRMVCAPVDTSKTVLQVQGPDGFRELWNRVLVVNDSDDGDNSNTPPFLINPAPLYQGAWASAAATAAGHFPWYLTYNYLNDEHVLPTVSREEHLVLFLVRAALVGLCASCVSDTLSNGLRVIKTTKQTSTKDDMSYGEAVSLVLEQDGWMGLLGRGLQTRLLTNMIQGAVFSVLWKYFQSR